MHLVINVCFERRENNILDASIQPLKRVRVLAGGKRLFAPGSYFNEAIKIVALTFSNGIVRHDRK